MSGGWEPGGGRGERGGWGADGRGQEAGRGRGEERRREEGARAGGRDARDPRDGGARNPADARTARDARDPRDGGARNPADARIARDVRGGGLFGGGARDTRGGSGGGRSGASAINSGGGRSGTSSGAGGASSSSDSGFRRGASRGDEDRATRPGGRGRWDAAAGADQGPDGARGGGSGARARTVVEDDWLPTPRGARRGGLDERAVAPAASRPATRPAPAGGSRFDEAWTGAGPRTEPRRSLASGGPAAGGEPADGGAPYRGARPRQRSAPAGAARQAPDYLLLLIVAALVTIGMVMVYSASSVEGAVGYHDPAYFLKRQLAGLVVGVLALLFCMNFPYWNWRRLAPAIMIVTVGMLFLVLIPHVGIQVLGARRWLGFHSLRIQPSEVAKLSLVIYFADWLARAGPRLQRARTGIVPYLALVALVGGLILAEPDLGTAAAITGTSLVMLFVAGVPVSHLVTTAIAGVPVLGYAIFGSAYRRARFLAFLNPQADALGSGYHIMQALYALGSGGLFGLGLGMSRQKYFYLPERHTDFIFAILGEELGLVGGLLLLALFLLLIWRGFRIAVSAPDTFSSLLAAGVTTMVAVQVVVNVGVVTSVLPITGITLPFISFGSSSLVFMLAGMGILCNVSRYARL